MAESPPATPDNAQTHLDQAYLFEEQGEYENALQECDAALRSDPTLAETHNLRGIVLEELGRKKEAREAYYEALRLEPCFSLAAKNLAVLETELLTPLLGARRAKGVRRLRLLGLASRILAWVFLAVHILTLLPRTISLASQYSWWTSAGIQNAVHMMVQQELYFETFSFIGIAVNGAVLFAILLILSIICTEFAEISKSHYLSTWERRL